MKNVKFSTKKKIIYNPHNVLSSGLRTSSTKMQLFDTISIYIHNKVTSNLVEHWIKEETVHIAKAAWAGVIRVKYSEDKKPWAFKKFKLSTTALNFLEKELEENYPELYEEHLMKKIHGNKYTLNKCTRINGKLVKVVGVKPYMPTMEDSPDKN